MATELGQAYVQIMPSAKGISKNIEKELNVGAQVAKKSGGKLGTAMKLGLISAVAGIGAVVGKAIMEGGELEQNLGGTEAVFGDFAKNIQASASEAYKNMGMSASDYMATANKMGSLFQGSGLDQQKSLDMTSKAMQRAADVASVMGVDTSMAMESIAGAAKGNFTKRHLVNKNRVNANQAGSTTGKQIVVLLTGKSKALRAMTILCQAA